MDITRVAQLVTMRGSRGDRESGPPSPQKSPYGLSAMTGPDPKNYKAAKPVFNVGPSSARQFRWRANDGVVFGSSLPLSTKKEQKVGLP